MKMHTAHRPGGHRRSATAVRLAAALVTAGCAVAASACGASGGSGPTAVGATTATGDASPLGLSQCMRAHGVANFPDPTKGPGGEGLSITATPGSPTLTVQGITFSGPAFQKAKQACKRYLSGNGPPPSLSASQRAKLLTFAKCVRAHGVPTFGDPTSAPTGVVATQRPAAKASSPAFRHAITVCGGPPGLRVRR